MRYLGGKQKIMKYLAPFLNRHTENRPYYEPFLGGANVMEWIVSPERFGMDIHCPLIAMWDALQKGWKPPSQIDEQEYQSAMNGYYRNIPEMESFILFGSSYGGRYRGGYARGETENGRERNYAQETRDSLIRAIHKMMDVHFMCGNALSEPVPRPSMVIYCDPPYMDTTPYIGVKRFDHHEFHYHVVPKWVSEGHLVFISGYDVPEHYESVWSLERKSTMKLEDVSDDEPRVEHVYVHQYQVDKVDRQKQMTLWDDSFIFVDGDD